MKKDTVVALKKPEVVTEDLLMEVLRKGAQQLSLRALETLSAAQAKRIPLVM
jgi:hypothetical protein